MGGLALAERQPCCLLDLAAGEVVTCERLSVRDWCHHWTHVERP